MLKPESPIGKAMAQLIEERDQARGANEDMAKRLAAAQARIGGLETELASMRDARVSAWLRVVELLTLPADATPDAVVSALETLVREHHDAHACFDAEQDRAEACLDESEVLYPNLAPPDNCPGFEPRDP